jgi:hypothetical protein
VASGINERIAIFEFFLGHGKHVQGFLVNSSLALKETTNSTKHPKRNKNYNKILEKPFIFNLQTAATPP